LSIPERLADSITAFVGLCTFIIMHVVWFWVWIVYDVEEFPFGLLTMIVSLETILLSTFIMISQSRQFELDRIQVQIDYETNISAKNEVEELQRTIARLETGKLDDLLKEVQKTRSRLVFCLTTNVLDYTAITSLIVTLSLLNRM